MTDGLSLGTFAMIRNDKVTFKRSTVLMIVITVFCWGTLAERWGYVPRIFNRHEIKEQLVPNHNCKCNCNGCHCN